MTAAPEAFKELLPVCISEILETMFFCDVQPAAGPDSAAGEPVPGVLRVVVGFDGKPSGRFWMWISAAAASALAADFLGLERDEIDSEKGGQTACELANMICGSVVSRIESDTAFQLAAPRLVEVTEPGLPEPQQRFLIDGGSLAVACRLTGA